MKTLISNREAIEQLHEMTDFSYKASEIIIEHYAGTDDEYLFDPIQISEDWHEYTAEEIREEYDVSPQELSDSVVHYCPVEAQTGYKFLFTFGD
tara:strand:+ start:59 stop:340 length:282 start_codon:yes stop_codon:yes gene_type:complete